MLLRIVTSAFLSEFGIYLDDLFNVLSLFSSFSCSRSGNFLALELAHLDLGSSSSLDGDIIPAGLAI